jgi:hypothetical protein
LKSPAEVGERRNRDRQTVFGGGTEVNPEFASARMSPSNAFLPYARCFSTH